MKKFTRSLSVKWRLAVFVCFLVMLVIAAGLGGLTGMRSVNQSLSDVYEHQVLPFEDLRKIDSTFHSGIVDIVDNVLFEQISWAEALKTIKENKMYLDKKWADLYGLGDAHTGVNGNGWLEPSRNLITATDKATATLIRHLENTDIDALNFFSNQTLNPLAEEHRQIINLLIQDRLLAIKTTYNAAQEYYLFSKMAFLATILVGILISVIISYLLVKSIDVPLKKIINAMRQVIRGDLTQHLEYGRHDEFGLLIKGFNQMASYLRDLVGQIQRSGIQVTSSITELAATNKQQEVSANEHAATTSEIAASTHEIAATGDQLLKTMKQVNSLTQNAAFAAEQGQKGLKGIDATMVKMEEATGSIVTKLQVLNERASNIAGVVNTINKVADQTNLLSLNAAIEAEKAGEYGSGFSVVASEIRRLADQTAVATYDIAHMVREVQSAIAGAVTGIDKFTAETNAGVKNIHLISDNLSGVIDMVEVLTPQVESLSGGIEAQTQGANQISEAISQLNETAQHTAETLSQTSTAISHLHNAALGLQESTALFKVETNY